MYQVEAWSALQRARGESRPRVGLRVGRNVVALGITSLLTDVSSEMVSTVLPIYLELHLGLTPLQFGVVDGLYYGITTVVRLISGLTADRWHRYKEVAIVGYGISALCKIGLLFTGSAWPLLAGIVTVDRVGKGVRTAPRDALISLSTTPENLALGFGVHRAFDSAGAMLGPLVALGIMAMLPARFDVVFAWSFSIAVIGVGVLLFFVENVRPSAPRRVDIADRSPEPVSNHGHGLLALTAAAAALSLTTVSDAFLYLLIQRHVGFSTGLFPLLYVGSAACYLVLAIPAGRLADRIGRRVAFLGGHALLGAAYFITMKQDLGLLSLGGCLLFLGGYYALTDGVLMALATTLCPPDKRASGMAVVGSVTSGARFIASIGFGALWTWYGADTAVTVFSWGLAGAIALAGLILTLSFTRHETDACTP
jgi:MFS family permease